MAFHGQVNYCANRMDRNIDLGVCLNGRRGDVEPESYVVGISIFVGLLSQPYECYWELRHTFG